MDSYDETLTNPSQKGKSKKEPNDFWFKKPTPKEKTIMKCFIKTKNGVEYSIVETTIKNPCKKKNNKYFACEWFDDSNTSEPSNSRKKLTSPNHYAMPKGYNPPTPDFLPQPPSRNHISLPGSILPCKILFSPRTYTSQKRSIH